MSPKAIQLALEMQSIKIPLDVIERWTEEEQKEAMRWAAGVALHRANNPTPVHVQPYVIRLWKLRIGIKKN